MDGLFLWTNLLAQSNFDRGPFEPLELLARGFIPLILAYVIFSVCLRLEGRGLAKTVKWAAIIPLIVGAFLGIEPIAMIFNDPTYKDLYGGGNRTKFLHMSPVIVSVLGAIALVVWNKLKYRQHGVEI
ncbi:MAG: hypothetical protein KIT11_00120 [Fimbriimonadaceae bacterium]|nr:hypothetical protein [Fimbriimonadaceae bacterium]QYK55220.1 MAG: hypothetical protein KF733_09415 [Fimbriimonadaceae bacterium]